MPVKCADQEEIFVNFDNSLLRYVEIYSRNAFIGYGQVLEGIRIASLNKMQLYGAAWEKDMSVNKFQLKPGEKIIGIKSKVSKVQPAVQYDLQFLILEN